MQTPPYSSLFDQWQNYQKSYLDAWRTMSESATPGAALGTPWHDLLEKWWKTFSNETPPDSRDLFSMLVEQGKSFFEMASTVKGSLAEAMNVKSNGGQWENVLCKCFDGLRDSLTAGASTFPMELWHKFVIDHFQANGDFIPNFIKQMQSAGKQMLSVPAVGQSREKQEKLQKLAIEFSEFQAACFNFSEVQAKIHNLAVDLLQEKVIEKFNKQDYPESFRAIYDLWIDCYEEVYADAVMQPEYNQAYSNMVNSLMGMTLRYRALQDDTLEAMGLPSRKELDTLYKRFQEERRQTKVMRAEIQTLKGQIDALTKGLQAVVATHEAQPEQLAEAGDEAAPEQFAEADGEAAPSPAPRRRATRRSSAAADKS